MRILFFLLSMIIFAQTPRIVLDTDFGLGADDLMALAMLNQYHKQEACVLEGVVSSIGDAQAISAISGFQRFYGLEDVPLAGYKGTTPTEEWSYIKILSKKFPSAFHWENVPESTVFYRELLHNSAPKSITIVCIGTLINIKKLIESSADEYIPFSGKELVAQKVKNFVIMGGAYPEGINEWNFNAQKEGLTKFVLENIDTPITFVGFELGEQIETGAGLNVLPQDCPLSIGLHDFCENAPWAEGAYNGQINSNGSFDQVAVLFAVEPQLPFFDMVAGTCLPDNFGGNRWKKDDGNHQYLILNVSPNRVANYIEQFILDGNR